MTPTVAEILEAIAAAKPSVADPEGALTTQEWMAKLGMGKRPMELAMRGLLAAGRATMVKVKRQRIDGVWVSYPAYQLVTSTRVKARK